VVSLRWFLSFLEFDSSGHYMNCLKKSWINVLQVSPCVFHGKCSSLWVWNNMKVSDYRIFNCVHVFDYERVICPVGLDANLIKASLLK